MLNFDGDVDANANADVKCEQNLSGNSNCTRSHAMTPLPCVQPCIASSCSSSLQTSSYPGWIKSPHVPHVVVLGVVTLPGVGGGGYSQPSPNSKGQDLPKFQFLGRGGTLSQVQTQSAKICLNFNFRGGGQGVFSAKSKLKVPRSA